MKITKKKEEEKKKGAISVSDSANWADNNKNVDI